MILNSTIQSLLGIIVLILHLILFLFTITGVFFNDIFIILLHLITCVNILIHWLTNNDLCCLTVMESKLLNIPIEDTFFNKLFSPVYSLQNKKDTGIFYYILIVLILISTFKLINYICRNKIYEKFNKNKL